MDTITNTDLTSFLDFCKSLDSGIVHTPEQALDLYRTRYEGRNGTSIRSSDLGRDLLRLREQIVPAARRF